MCVGSIIGLFAFSDVFNCVVPIESDFAGSVISIGSGLGEFLLDGSDAALNVFLFDLHTWLVLH